MTRLEFLHELEVALEGEMIPESVEGHVKYYNKYIMDEVRKGCAEEEVVDSLGSPRLIAKTLIDTAKQFGPMFRQYQDEEDISPKKKGWFRMDYSPEEGWDVRLGKLKLNSWYGKLALALLAGLLLVAVANLMAFLIPVLAPAILILLVCSIIFGSRR